MKIFYGLSLRLLLNFLTAVGIFGGGWLTAADEVEAAENEIVAAIEKIEIAEERIDAAKEEIGAAEDQILAARAKIKASNRDGTATLAGGAIAIPPGVFANLSKAGPIAGAAFREPSISLRKRFPEPRDQGTMKACVSFAACYAVKTYLERTRNGWADSDQGDEYVFSPAFIHNQIVAQSPDGPLQDRGTMIQSALSILAGAGCPTWKTFPYNGVSAYVVNDQSVWLEAAKYKRDKWDPMDIKNLSMVRQYISSGRPIVIGATVDTWKEGRWHRDQFGITKRLLKVESEYHAMVVVGYDDNKGGEGNGAVEIMNSWGKNWNDGGFGWISYDFWGEFVNEGYVVWDSKEESKTFDLPAGVKISDVRWLPPGPEGKKNGNWGYPNEVELKGLRATSDRMFPAAVKEVMNIQSP